MSKDLLSGKKRDESNSPTGNEGKLSRSSGQLCSICLNTINNRALADTCLHEFCYDCLSEWSSSHNRCPNCRTEYKNIMFNITSENEFEQIAVPEPSLFDINPESFYRMFIAIHIAGVRQGHIIRRNTLMEEIATMEVEMTLPDITQERSAEIPAQLEELREELEEANAGIEHVNEAAIRIRERYARSNPPDTLDDVLDQGENTLEDLLAMPNGLMQLLHNPDNDDDDDESLSSLVSQESSPVSLVSLGEEASTNSSINHDFINDIDSWISLSGSDLQEEVTHNVNNSNNGEAHDVDQGRVRRRVESHNSDDSDGMGGYRSRLPNRRQPSIGSPISPEVPKNPAENYSDVHDSGNEADDESSVKSSPTTPTTAKRRRKS